MVECGGEMVLHIFSKNTRKYRKKDGLVSGSVVIWSVCASHAESIVLVKSQTYFF